MIKTTRSVIDQLAHCSSSYRSVHLVFIQVILDFRGTEVNFAKSFFA